VTEPGDRRTAAALTLTIGALAVFNVARSTVLPDGWDLAANLAVTAVVGGLAWWAGLTAIELGLARADAGRGLRWGLLAFGAVTAVLVVVALVPATRDFFDDDRAEVGFGSMLFEVLVAIPLGTVLLEELAFRGSLLALLRRRRATWVAVVVSSLLFGLWHIAPAITSSGTNDAVVEAGVNLAGTVVGTVLATFVAGLVFCWLRLRSRSLIAPMLGHLATNGVAFTLAWILTR
jgi:membrane protease YdiL (CAAX protease family)